MPGWKQQALGALVPSVKGCRRGQQGDERVG